jgi:hypothetical protein
MLIEGFDGAISDTRPSFPEIMKKVRGLNGIGPYTGVIRFAGS